MQFARTDHSTRVAEVAPAISTGFWALVTVRLLTFMAQALFWTAAGLLSYRHYGTGGDEMLLLRGVLVFLPAFWLASPLAGAIADKWSRSSILRWGTLLETVAACAGIYSIVSWGPPSSGNVYILGASLFAWGALCAIVSAARQGILPDLVPEEKLVDGAGSIQLAEAIGALLGFILAGGLIDHLQLEAKIAWGLFLIGTPMLFATFASFLIPAAAPADPDIPLSSAWKLDRVAQFFHSARSDRRTRDTAVALIFFWGIAAVFGRNTFPYGDLTLGLEQSPMRQGWLFIALFVGLGIGSWFAGRLSIGTVELGLVPLGALGGAVAALGLAATASFYPAVAFYALAGLAAGWYLIPFNAFLVTARPNADRSSAVAAVNMAGLAGVALGLGAVYSLRGVLSPRGLFLVAGLVLLVATVRLFIMLPDYFVRFAVYVSSRLIWRPKIVGLENVPTNGPALIVFNHTSFADGNLITSVFPRFVRFLVYQGHYELPFLRWLGKVFNAVAVDGRGSPKEIVKALRRASDILNNGQVLIVFAEGSISRTGFLLPFQRGFEMIMKHSPAVPIIPGYIDGMWGSVFSFKGGKFFWKWPSRPPFPVTILFGKPMPSDSTAFQVREQVQLLGVEAFERRKPYRIPLHRDFIRKAKKFARRPCVGDSLTKPMTFGQTLMRSVIFSRILKRELGPEPFVGIFTPPSVGTALANIAVSFLGKAPVNLNYTIGNEVLDTCVHAAGIKQVLTSKRFLERVPLRPDAELIMLEDLRDKVTTADKLVGLAARFMPAWFTDRFILGTHKHTCDQLATLIFSSGSTGIPKGVMLSHHNILSNIESVVQMVDADENDKILGVLPIFHSFGYTVTFWLPTLIGASIVFHFSPLDAEIIGKLCREYKLTIGVSTATFLRNYMRKCKPEDFASLRLLVCGAEKLPVSLAEQFEERFTIRPLEGYGCTELSPVVSANRPDVVIGPYRQIGTKFGTIGHPMPGQAVRIVEPETWAPLPVGQDGMLIVKGSNVMVGYYKNPKMTEEVIRDGWYQTGDIARLDEDGFITITDRLSRFSKIGGEMVPHGKVEDLIHEVLDTQERMCAVVGIPDQRKGERLVVIHTPMGLSPAEIWEKLKEKGLPGIWLPAKNAFFEVAELPVLGAGKLDLRQVKKIAQQKAESG